MKAFPGLFSLPHRSKFLMQILILAFALNAPDKIVAQVRSGETQLRTAVASNSEAELQKVESSLAGTESAAMARDWPHEAFVTWFLRQNLHEDHPRALPDLLAKIAAKGIAFGPGSGFY